MTLIKVTKVKKELEGDMEVYDVAIIGGGVVGVSILYELTLRGYKCVLLEKEKDIAAGASSGNSGMIHSGFDAEPGTLEFNLILKGNAKMKAFIEKHNIPCRNMGAIMIAQTKEELKKIQALHETVTRSGVTETNLLTQEQVRKLEPNLTERVIGGLHIPQETVIDSCLYVVAMAHHAVKNGAKVLRECEVRSLHQPVTGRWELTTSQTPVQSQVVVNAAGLYGDHVNMMGLGTSPFRIKPRQGDFIVLGEEANNLVQHIILPIPTTKTKGVIVYPSVYGNLVIGPTAEETQERDNPVTTTKAALSLNKYGNKIVPDLVKYRKFETYAGIRPATEYKDFQIAIDVNRRWVTVGGIRSTGLTASMGIAVHIAETVGKEFRNITPSHRRRVQDHSPSRWQADKTSYRLDGKAYTITHKLMRLGLNTQSKL